MLTSPWRGTTPMEQIVNPLPNIEVEHFLRLPLAATTTLGEAQV
jgi:hypothetical protein